MKLIEKKRILEKGCKLDGCKKGNLCGPCSDLLFFLELAICEKEEVLSKIIKKIDKRENKDNLVTLQVVKVYCLKNLEGGK